MEDNYYEIEVNNKKINLEELSEEELEELEAYLIEERKLIRKKIDKYLDSGTDDLNT